MSQTDRNGDDTVLATGEDGIGIISLNRPHRRNALTADVLSRLQEALRDLSSRSDIKVIVLRGEGRAFCSGLDLDVGIRDSDSDDEVESLHSGIDFGLTFVHTLRVIPQPIIAVVHGHAVGAGFALAAAADIRFIAEDAQFSAPFLSLGMSVGDLGLSWFLPRIVGHGRASELFFAAGTIDAAQAVEWGLASRISEDPLEAAMAFALRICAFPPYGVHASKSLINAAMSAGLRDHLESEVRAQTIGAMTTNAITAMATALGDTKSTR